jgi:CheY-like chemotaxis protein
MQDGGELVIGTRNAELDEPSARRIGDLSAGRYVVLSVMDDGHGMTREMAARVFEPFFTTKTEERGTGLGLSMVYGFVRQSGGDVRIVSVPDGGTTVELYLPASESDATEEPLASTAKIPPAAVSGTERVLVVEDDPAVRELGVSMLTALGYDVVAASNGAAAVAVLEQDDSVDIVFTDVVMPGGMSGPELARRARELRPDIKVVLTSGYPQNDDDSISLGKDELLPKPYSNVQLSTCIRRVLDGGRAQ